MIPVSKQLSHMGGALQARGTVKGHNPALKKSKTEEKDKAMLPVLLLQKLAMRCKGSEKEGAMPCRPGTRWMGTSLP